MFSSNCFLILLFPLSRLQILPIWDRRNQLPPSSGDPSPVFLPKGNLPSPISPDIAHTYQAIPSDTALQLLRSHARLPHFNPKNFFLSSFRSNSIFPLFFFTPVSQLFGSMALQMCLYTPHFWGPAAFAAFFTAGINTGGKSQKKKKKPNTPNTPPWPGQKMAPDARAAVPAGSGRGRPPRGGAGPGGPAGE